MEKKVFLREQKMKALPSTREKENTSASSTLGKLTRQKKEEEMGDEKK